LREKRFSMLMIGLACLGAAAGRAAARIGGMGVLEMA
jgi:hypothetical protein